MRKHAPNGKKWTFTCSWVVGGASIGRRHVSGTICVQQRRVGQTVDVRERGVQPQNRIAPPREGAAQRQHVRVVCGDQEEGGAAVDRCQNLLHGRLQR